MSKQYLKYNSFTKHKELEPLYNIAPSHKDISKCLPNRYVGFMYELRFIINDIGFEEVISKSSSIQEFEDNLIANFPGYKTVIKNKLKKYEQID